MIKFLIERRITTLELDLWGILKKRFSKKLLASCFHMISDNKIVQLSITCLVPAAHQDQELALTLAPEIRWSHSSFAPCQDSFTISTAFVANQVISYCLLVKHPSFHNLRFPDLHHRCPCHLATSQDPVMPLR